MTADVTQMLFELEKTIHGSATVITAIESGKEIDTLKAIKAICKSQHRIALCLYGQYIMATTKELEGRTDEEFQSVLKDRIRFLSHSLCGEVYEPVSDKRK